jgi:hypothetical protein
MPSIFLAKASHLFLGIVAFLYEETMMRSANSRQF